MLTNLVKRGLGFDDGLGVVIDGATALAAAVGERFGTKAVIQRCPCIMPIFRIMPMPLANPLQGKGFLLDMFG